MTATVCAVEARRTASDSEGWKRGGARSEINSCCKWQLTLQKEVEVNKQRPRSALAVEGTGQQTCIKWNLYFPLWTPQYQYRQCQMQAHSVRHRKQPITDWKGHLVIFMQNALTDAFPVKQSLPNTTRTKDLESTLALITCDDPTGF